MELINRTNLYSVKIKFQFNDLHNSEIDAVYVSPTLLVLVYVNRILNCLLKQLFQSALVRSNELPIDNSTIILDINLQYASLLVVGYLKLI